MMSAFSINMASEEQVQNKMRSYTSITEITASKQGRRKSGGSLLQGLKFWKKDKKRNARSLPMIGKPMQFQHVSGTSSRRPACIVEDRSQKTVSLPYALTRRSALTSHAPSIENLPLEKPNEPRIDFEAPPRRILHRRATLPKLSDSVPDEHAPTARRQSVLEDGQVVDPADIGFAVTSGSNFLKRRSRSANALRITSSEPQSQFSPTFWSREQRRRSDDMACWREGASSEPADNLVQSAISQNQTQTEVTDPAQSMPIPIPELPSTEIPTSEENHNVISGHDQIADSTFHFGDFSIKADDGEQAISMEERVTAVEVRLMDMQYAISKLQDSSLASSMMADRTRPMQDMLGRDSSVPSQRSQLNSDAATERTVSTQPTTISAFSTSEDTSAQSRLQIDTDDSSHFPAQVYATADLYRRNSLNALTIDHLNSLLGLIRREQAARHRLEDQIVELQREFKSLRQQLLSPSMAGTAYAALIGWNRVPQPERLLDDSETDDGVHEIYTTPTEYTRRAVYEGGVFAGQREGVAF